MKRLKKTLLSALAVLFWLGSWWILALAIGKPHVIDDDKVAFMRDFAENHYGQGK